MKVLVIEDEKLVAESIRAILEHKGFEVETVYDGEAGKEYAELGIYDLLILDVMMPKLDGFQVARQVRADRCATPILMLTARSDIEDRIQGLNAGADYYLTKPFGVMELVSCVKAVLRRCGTKPAEQLRSDGLVLDETEHTVTVDGERVALTFKEFELLTYFMENKGIALSREKILNNVWNYDYFGDARTIDTHVKKLRSKLGPKGDNIKTVWGMGYKLEVDG